MRAAAAYRSPDGVGSEGLTFEDLEAGEPPLYVRGGMQWQTSHGHGLYEQRETYGVGLESLASSWDRSRLCTPRR